MVIKYTRIINSKLNQSLYWELFSLYWLFSFSFFKLSFLFCNDCRITCSCKRQYRGTSLVAQWSRLQAQRKDWPLVRKLRPVPHAPHPPAQCGQKEKEERCNTKRSRVPCTQFPPSGNILWNYSKSITARTLILAQSRYRIVPSIQESLWVDVSYSKFTSPPSPEPL